MNALNALCAGALLMGGLILGIGPQNLFVVRTALRQRKRWLAPLVCSACDGLLVVLGVATSGTLIAFLEPQTQKTLAQAAALLLVGYALNCLCKKAPPHGPNGESEGSLTQESPSDWRITFLALGFSLLSPWVYLDSLVIVGLNALTFEAPVRVYFAAGAIAASCLWFFGLTGAAHMLRPVLQRPGAARTLDLIAAGCCLLAAWQLNSALG